MVRGGCIREFDGFVKEFDCINRVRLEEIGGYE